jgi:hypothetical protein
MFGVHLKPVQWEWGFKHLMFRDNSLVVCVFNHFCDLCVTSYMRVCCCLVDGCAQQHHSTSPNYKLITCMCNIIIYQKKIKIYLPTMAWVKVGWTKRTPQLHLLLKHLEDLLGGHLVSWVHVENTFIIISALESVGFNFMELVICNHWSYLANGKW